MSVRQGRGAWPGRSQGIGAKLPEKVASVAAMPEVVYAWPMEERFRPPATGPRRWLGYSLPILVGLGLLVGPTRARRLALISLGYASLALGSAKEYGDRLEVSGETIPLPFDLFYRHFPLANYASKPAQYGVGAWLVGAATVGASAAPALGLGVLAEVWWTGPTRLPLPAMRVGPLPVWEALRSMPRGAVIELPSPRAFRARARPPADLLLGYLFHRQPLGENLDRAPNPRYHALSDALAKATGWPAPPQAPPLARAWSAAASAGFRYLIVHGAVMTEDELEVLTAALRPLANAPRVFPDGTQLYEIQTTAPAANDPASPPADPPSATIPPIPAP